MDVSLFSPAKLNLFLVVTGRRADGFHDLISVVAPLDFGDELRAESRERGAGSQFTLACDDPEVPVDDSNLVLKAAAAFAGSTGWREGVDFRLTKRIPPGAGLGGGSSNAVAALRVLNQLSGGLLSGDRLTGIASALGSDCALFLAQAPVIMRGRGDRVELLPATAAARVRGRRALLFKPSFGISTPWAYRRMIARGSDYAIPAEVEARLSAWLQGTAAIEEMLANGMEPAAFEKYPALPLLLGRLHREFGVIGRMSGSGSACFVLPPDEQPVAPLIACIRECWGPAAFVQEARLV